MIKFFIIMILIMPWIFLPLGSVQDQFRLPQACFMDIMFLGLIVMSFYKGNNYIYRNKYLSWFLGYVFLNFVVYFFIPFSLDITGRGRMLNTASLEPMLNIFLGVWALQIILSNFERDDFIRIAKALCLSSTIMATFVILQYNGFDPLSIVNAKYNCQNQVSACLDNPNLVGNYLALCLPLFLIFEDVIYGWGGLLVIGGIYVSKAHFAQVLAVFAIALYFLLKYWKTLWVRYGIIVSSIIGSLVLLKLDFLKLYSGMDGRLFIWKEALHRFKANPLFGQGIGIWRSFDTTQNGIHWTYVHNDWLERAVEIGLVGIVLLVIVIFNAYKRFSYNKENLGYIVMFTTFLVMMIGSFPWEVATIATLGLISFTAVEKL